MKTDWFKVAAIFLVAGVFIGFFLFMVFPDAYADSSGPLREVYLSDHTRCVIIRNGAAGGITCDWERRYSCDSQRR